MIDEEFGIKKLDGEKVIFDARPDGFMKLQLMSCLVSVVGIPFIPFVWIAAKIAQNKFRYWLTNQRVILSSGFIGYKVRSIPLERISDVSLSRNVVEMLSGVSSLVVRDMTGEVQEGKSMLAISDGSEYQKQILDEVRRVNLELGRV